MMKKLALCLGLLLATGCGTATPALKLAPRAPEFKSKSLREFFPATVGYTWQYNVMVRPSDDDLGEPGTETLSVRSVNQTEGKTVLELKDEDSYLANFRLPRLTISDQGIELKYATYLGPLSAQADDLAIDYLHFPLQAGTGWDDGQWIGKNKGVESVTVPAGTYETWKIEFIGCYNNVYTAMGTYWLAPGVGIVKSALDVDGYSIESSLAKAGPARK